MKTLLITAILSLILLSACSGTIQIGIEANTPTTAAAMTPTATMVILPSPTSVMVAPTAISTPVTPAANTPSTQLVQVYLIAIDDNGQSGSLIGCGDSAIPVVVEVASTPGVLKAALQALLAVKDQYYGQSGLYNALYQSSLQVEGVTISNGKATVNLTGTLQMSGECDAPRVQAQLEKTVLQFSTVTSADIFIDGKTLAEALSLK